MKTLIKSNNPVLIGYARSLLDEAGIQHFVLDANMSVMEGSIGILPSRLSVVDDDEARARRVLVEAGLSDECASGDG